MRFHQPTPAFMATLRALELAHFGAVDLHAQLSQHLRLSATPDYSVEKTIQSMLQDYYIGVLVERGLADRTALDHARWSNKDPLAEYGLGSPTLNHSKYRYMPARDRLREVFLDNFQDRDHDFYRSQPASAIQAGPDEELGFYYMGEEAAHRHYTLMIRWQGELGQYYTFVSHLGDVYHYACDEERQELIYDPLQLTLDLPRVLSALHRLAPDDWVLYDEKRARAILTRLFRWITTLLPGDEDTAYWSRYSGFVYSDCQPGRHIDSIQSSVCRHSEGGVDFFIAGPSGPPSGWQVEFARKHPSNDWCIVAVQDGEVEVPDRLVQNSHAFFNAYRAASDIVDRLVPGESPLLCRIEPGVEADLTEPKRHFFAKDRTTRPQLLRDMAEHDFQTQ